MHAAKFVHRPPQLKLRLTRTIAGYGVLGWPAVLLISDLGASQNYARAVRGRICLHGLTIFRDKIWPFTSKSRALDVLMTHISKN